MAEIRGPASERQPGYRFLEQPWLTEDDSEMGGSAVGEELLIFPDTPIFVVYR